MRITKSLGRKALVTLVATGGLVWLLEATIFDSQKGSRRGVGPHAASDSAPGGSVATFTATAYCTGTVTSAGVTPQGGVAAADPTVLPTGSIVDVETGDAMLTGLYTVLDTGPNMKGRRIDLYTKSCSDAVRFGRRTVRVNVLRSGWSPTGPTSVPSSESRRDGDTPARRPSSGPLPSRPLPDVNAPAH